MPSSEICRIPETAPILQQLAPHVASVSEDQVERLKLWQGDKRIEAAVAAIEEGRQVVNLRAALKHGMANGMNLPRLAVARADRPRIDCTVRRTGMTVFRTKRWKYEMSSMPWSGDPIVRSAIADVPMIPAALRVPNMKEHLIFWEPEWRRVTQRNERHITWDPALLEHIVGDLYVVVAAWELTALEVAALS